MGKATGELSQVIVGEVVDVPPIVIDIQPEQTEKALGYAHFVVIAVRRLNGQAQSRRVQDRDVGRTGQQDVPKRRCLEDPVISSVDQQISFSEITRNTQAGANAF